MANGGQRCLDAFARTVVDARDDTLDEVAAITDEQARDPVASLVRSRLRGNHDRERVARDHRKLRRPQAA